MIEYCTFDKSGIYDFRGVILPNVWDDLAVAENYEELGLQLIGALRDGERVGALVARFLENEEVYIYSLYVRSDCRGQGIAGEMLMELCALASEVYTRCVTDDFPLFFHTEYALPTEDALRFEAFLRKQGFTDFFEKDATYLFEKQDIETALSGCNVHSEGIARVSELAGYREEIYTEAFDAAGYAGDPRLCFVHIREGEPDFLVSAAFGGEGDFYLSSTTAGGEADEARCADTVLSLLKALCEDYGSFSLIVDGETNVELPLWEELARSGGTVCTRAEAGMYVVFEE